MLMLAGGGEACSDVEALRAQPALFGSVPSDSTLYRTFRKLDADTLAGLWEAMAEVRTQVWRRSSATTGSAEVVFDIDASLVTSLRRTRWAVPTYKGGYGFHPMFCFADATGEVLAALLRPGNAGANSISDHLSLLDAAVTQLPAEVAVGHRPGDDATLVARAVRVRTDSAGCSAAWPPTAGARNISFSVVARSNAVIAAAISPVGDDEGRWSGAVAPGRPLSVPDRRWPSSPTPGRSVRLARGNPAGRAPRGPAPRRPDQPVPLDRVPLLGPLHRRRR